jgi:Tfp pilus assembly PilM family ATPase
MIAKGALQFSSSIPIAGNSFNERIAQALGISSQKADMIKKQIGFQNTPEYPNLKTTLLPVLSNLTEEIKNILKFHQEHFEQQVQRILLSGGNATTENLAAYLTEALSEFNLAPVQIAEPWACIGHIDKPPLPHNEALTFTAAIGLAQRAMQGNV